jgi:FixJ family two-component response regulator
VISIIDDDQSVRLAAKRLFKSLGYATATFTSAEEFLESGCLRDTQCLISDVQMPGMSGVDLQCHLVQNGCCPPMIFVTAFSEENVRKRALEAGAYGFLKKPFREESLMACLDEALKGHKIESST